MTHCQDRKKSNFRSLDFSGQLSLHASPTSRKRCIKRSLKNWLEFCVLKKSLNCLSDYLFFLSFSIKGGLSTTDEMCLSFILYYPKVDVKKCMSREKPAYDAWVEKYYK